MTTRLHEIDEEEEEEEEEEEGEVSEGEETVCGWGRGDQRNSGEG